ncbi:hypothetical protein AB5N19_13536 [Seiridium cardinale]
MPTPIDNALRSKNAFLGFAGIVTAAAAWAIWGGDMFPAAADPTGNPEGWTKSELRRWLAARNLHPQDGDTREQLLERVKANMRTFTSLPTLRPSLLRPTGTIFRSSTPTTSLAPTSATTARSEVVDIVPKTAISSSPIFGATQIRCGPRATLARSSRLVRKRRHGFLSRIRTRTGRRTLQRRRTKGRHTLSN